MAPRGLILLLAGLTAYLARRSDHRTAVAILEVVRCLAVEKDTSAMRWKLSDAVRELRCAQHNLYESGRTFVQAELRVNRRLASFKSSSCVETSSRRTRQSHHPQIRQYLAADIPSRHTFIFYKYDHPRNLTRINSEPPGSKLPPWRADTIEHYQVHSSPHLHRPWQTGTPANLSILCSLLPRRPCLPSRIRPRSRQTRHLRRRRQGRQNRRPRLREALRHETPRHAHHTLQNLLR